MERRLEVDVTVQSINSEMISCCEALPECTYHDERDLKTHYRGKMRAQKWLFALSKGLQPIFVAGFIDILKDDSNEIKLFYFLMSFKHGAACHSVRWMIMGHTSQD
ncbi:hypothetical protein ACLOJK_010848 [Asimina triloba]